MDSRSRSSSPASLANKLNLQPAPPSPDKISAYYSLVFPHFTFYIQTLSITIGRRCPNPNAATSSTAEPQQVDVDLGALKSVSRLHAKIEYDQDEDRFVLAVIGRNGAWVDGVWSGSGTRAALGERSQIQIASRTFHFVLPPPPPPEDSPSPSSQSSANRQRSPSLDITSISPPSSQPSHSPPPVKTKLPPPQPEPQIQPQLPNTNAIGKSNKAANPKKRKKSDIAAAPIIVRPKPEDMPPKPPFTYALLISRAIKDIGGKATLQEICSWIMTNYEYYKYTEMPWMSSIRHNLSSGQAFVKMERCGGDRGKGFFWSIAEEFKHKFEEQEAKILQAAANPTSQAPGPGGKDGNAKSGRKKDKGASLLEPALKRSVKGDIKGGVLPPPLTSAPLAVKAPAAIPSSSTPAATGVFAYPTHPHQAVTMQQPANVTSGYSGSPMSAPNPYAPLMQPHWGLHTNANGTSTVASSSASTSTMSIPSTSATPIPSQPPSSTPTPLQPIQPQAGAHIPDVVIPIVLGPIPPTHPDYSPTDPNNSAKEGYMVLHERKLILDPDVFAGLTPEMLAELEKMGARAALVVLTGHMVRALKERRAKRGRERGGRRGRGQGVGRGRRGGGAGAITGGPFTNTPLEKRNVASMDASGRGGAVQVSGDTEPPGPTPPPPPPPPASVPEPVSNSASGQGDIGSPIVVVDDSDDDGPSAKRRKMDEVVPMVVGVAVPI